MLEPYEGKLSRTVLRREGGSNLPDLSDKYNMRKVIGYADKVSFSFFIDNKCNVKN